MLEGGPLVISEALDHHVVVIGKALSAIDRIEGCGSPSPVLTTVDSQETMLR